MHRRIAVFTLLCLMIVSAFAISCGGRKGEIPTPPVSTQPLERPTSNPDGSRPTLFLDPKDLMAAYAGKRPVDQSMTPRALQKKNSGEQNRPHNFPRILSVVLDKDGNPIVDLGFGGVAIQIERFVIAPLMPDLQASDLPPPLQEKGARGGVMIIVGERPDGAPDYEILKRSVARNEKITLEIFERQPNPRYPFTSLFPFEIQDPSELRAGDPLIFYGYTQGTDGKYYPTQKPATISEISSDEPVIMMNGSVTGGDFGAPVFSYQCGVEKLVGIIISSRAHAGFETEVFVIGIKKALNFLEESTDIRVQVKESQSHCPPKTPALNERAIQALSDGRYDFSYDLCDLRETCDLAKERQWVRPFQDVWVSKENPTEEGVGGWGNAFITGSYVAVVSSAAPYAHWLAQGGKGSNYNILHRIVWDGSYEYLALLGVDSSGKIAVFKRAQDSKFPMPPMPLSLVGNSQELKIGNAMLSIGAADLAFFTGRKPYDMRKTIDPASLIGLSGTEKDIFYVQGQMRAESKWSAICALRDGDCEFVGFLYEPLNSEQAETLNKALTIEFVLKAMDEVICSDKELSCPNLSRLSLEARGIRPKTPQELGDKARIIELLKDQKPDSSSLLFDQMKPDLSGLTRFRTQISLSFFDKTGAIIQGPGSIPGEALILGDSYLLTSAALFPKLFKSSDGGVIRDTSMGVLDVVLVDQENGYALLKKAIPGPLGNGGVGSFPLVKQKDIEPDQEILLAYSQRLLGGSYRTIDLVSPGTITHVAQDSSMFLINAFVSPEILGAPIFAKCDGQICVVGIVTRAYPVYFEQIKTEGFGVSLDFIFDKVKEKTGIDLRAAHAKE